MPNGGRDTATPSATTSGALTCADAFPFAPHRPLVDADRLGGRGHLRRPGGRADLGLLPLSPTLGLARPEDVNFAIRGLDREDLPVQTGVTGHGLVVDVQAQRLGDFDRFLGQFLEAVGEA